MTVVDRITETRPGGIDPLHEHRDPAKLADLVADMSEHGWRGAPIVVDGEQAITGSHRLAAVNALYNDTGNDLPVPRVDVTDLCTAYNLDWATIRDNHDDWYDAVRDLPDLLPQDVATYLGLDVH